MLINFSDYMRQDQAFNEWNPFRAAWKTADGLVSGLGTGVTQLGRGIGNTLMTPAHLAQMGLGGAKTIAGLGTADLGLMKRGGKQVLRGAGNLLKGPGQIISAPGAAVARGIQAGTNPFSWRKPIGGAADQFLGLGRADRSKTVPFAPKSSQSTVSDDSPVASPKSQPTQSQLSPEQQAFFQRNPGFNQFGHAPTSARKPQPHPQPQPVQPQPQPQPSDNELPDEIGINLRKARDLLDKLSMGRDVGKWADRKEKVISVLLGSYGKQNRPVTKDNWVKIAKSNYLDPIELYREIGKPYSVPTQNSNEPDRNINSQNGPVRLGLSDISRLRKQREASKKRTGMGGGSAPGRIDKLLLNLENILNGTHRLSNRKTTEITPEQMKFLGDYFKIDPKKIRKMLLSGNLEDLMD